MPKGKVHHPKVEIVAMLHAGLEVWEMQPMRCPTRDDEMKKSFVLHAKRIARTLGLLTDSMLAQIDSRTGEHLTREAQAVKRAFLNVWLTLNKVGRLTLLRRSTEYYRPICD